MATPEERAATHALRAAVRRSCTAVIGGGVVADQDRATINAALATAYHTLKTAPE